MGLRLRAPLARGAMTLLAVAAWAGCGDATEVVVVTDTNFPIPNGVAQVRATVTSPDGAEQVSTADLEGGATLPATLGIIHEGGPLGPYHVRIEGVRTNGAVRLDREASFDFEEGFILVLPMNLVRRCRTVRCSAGQTCFDDGRCRDVEIDSSTLEEWDGDPPSLSD